MKSIIYFFILVILCYVSNISSYSFDNHELNEYLKNSLEEFESFAEEEPRTKRDTEHLEQDDKFVCKHRHFKSCCGDENIMKKFVDVDKSIGKSCYKNVTKRMDKQKQKANLRDNLDFFSCEGLRNMKKKVYCVNECIGKKQELLNQDGSLNSEKLKSFVSALEFKETWQKENVESSITRCLQKDYYKQAFPKEESEEGGIDCNPTYLQFISCAYKEIELGCPEQYQKTSKKCKAMRDRFAENKKRMIELTKN